MSIWQRIVYAYWESQARYLLERLYELGIEAEHLEHTRREVERRLQRAENRCVQWKVM